MLELARENPRNHLILRLMSDAGLRCQEVVALKIKNASEVDAVAVIQEMTKGEGADATMDCTGVEEARINTLKSAKIWGRACFVGERGTATFDISQLFNHKQLTVYGSWTFSTHVLAEVANFVIDHKVKLRDTISHRFPLSRADEA